MVNEHGILMANPCDGHISTRWSCHVGDVTKNREQGTAIGGPGLWGRRRPSFLQFLFFFFVRGESWRILSNERQGKWIQFTFRSCHCKWKCEWDSNVKGWISFFSPINTGELLNPQRDPTGKAVSRDSLISSDIPGGQESRLKKTELLKPVGRLKPCWKTRETGTAESQAAGWPMAGRPARHPRPACRHFKCLCLVGCGMFQTSALASLIENIIFSINNASRFFISKLPGKSWHIYSTQ